MTPLPQRGTMELLCSELVELLEKEANDVDDADEEATDPTTLDAIELCGAGEEEDEESEELEEELLCTELIDVLEAELFLELEELLDGDEELLLQTC